MIIYYFNVYILLAIKKSLFQYLYKHEKIESGKNITELVLFMELLPDDITLNNEHLYVITLKNRVTGSKIDQLFLQNNSSKIILHHYGTHYKLQCHGRVKEFTEENICILKNEWKKLTSFSCLEA